MVNFWGHWMNQMWLTEQTTKWNKSSFSVLNNIGGFGFIPFKLVIFLEHLINEKGSFIEADQLYHRKR